MSSSQLEHLEFGSSSTLSTEHIDKDIIVINHRKDFINNDDEAKVIEPSIIQNKEACCNNLLLVQESVLHKPGQGHFFPDPKMMEALKKCWCYQNINQYELEWNISCDALECFGAIYEICNIPGGLICKLPDGGLLCLGDWLTKQRIAYSKSMLRKDRLSRLQEFVDKNMLTWEIDRGEEVWHILYVQLLKYGENNEDYNVPFNYKVTLVDRTQVKLGEWLHTQRQSYNNGTIREDRKLRLQKLVDEQLLSWEIIHTGGRKFNDDKWNDMLVYLLNYGVENGGNCNVPIGYVSILPDKTKVKLGVWLHNQRQAFKSGGLRGVRMHKLQALVDEGKLKWEVCNNWRAHNDSQWNRMYECLLAYGEKNKNYNVSRRYHFLISEKNPVKLGAWLYKQREFYKEGNLPKERREILQKLVDENKLTWDTDSNKNNRQPVYKWEDMFSYLVAYGELHNGDCNIPRNDGYIIPDDTVVNLGEWLSKQRQLRRNGTLGRERELQLQGLVDSGKLLWDVNTNIGCKPDDEKWNEMFQLLLEYGTENNGDCNVPSRFEITQPEGIPPIKLGTWLHNQRLFFKSGNIRDERRSALQDLVDQKKLHWDAGNGGCKPDNDSWDRTYDILLAYGEAHNGNCNAPRSCVFPGKVNPKFKLGVWLYNQKYKYRNADIADERKRKLEKLVEENKLNWELDPSYSRPKKKVKKQEVAVVTSSSKEVEP